MRQSVDAEELTITTEVNELPGNLGKLHFRSIAFYG
jgi:hypothetical protein